MIFARSLALRIYLDQITDHQADLVLKRDDLMVYSFGPASFAALFSFGVIVFWNVPLVKQRLLVKELSPYIKSPIRPEVTAAWRVDTGLKDQINVETIALQTIHMNEVIALSYVLAQYVVLLRMDDTVDKQLYLLNRILRPIEKYGKTKHDKAYILKKLGRVLRDRIHSLYEYDFYHIPSEASADDRIEQLYAQLMQILEIEDRMRVVNEKWDAVSDTMQFVLDLVKQKKGVRLEIIFLLCAVLIDIILTAWQIFSS